ncbi:glycosyltransferase involved in cell wall biosynthesis [Rhizobium sp. ERR 922]|nr:glycosyltransferase involved in cell wall biosynthesis [Rhizobium sp. ERR 922]TWB94096.1 glycosyltransferase involved in cell wall biosynthesis [Rhizobium sp. ERR 942]
MTVVRRMNSHVAILMGTFQGERFISEQMESILAQTHKDWELWISDDGSVDLTLSIVEQFRQKCAAPIRIVTGPKKGFIRNFLALACNPAISADFYSFADQDDIWHADKLERALAWLRGQPSEVPALYCSRTHIVDESGRSVGESPLFAKPPSFSNALVQSIGGGNTIVMNDAARRILMTAGSDVTVASHDWWAYIVVAGAGGRIHYDPVPPIDYRQHGSNLVGSNSGWRARVRRLRMLTKSQFRNWNTQNLAALKSIEHLLTKENRKTLELFRGIREEGFPRRLWTLYKSGLHRQTFLGNIGLVAAVILRQV